MTKRKVISSVHTATFSQLAFLADSVKIWLESNRYKASDLE